MHDKVKGIIEAKVAAIIEICCNAVTPKVVKQASEIYSTCIRKDQNIVTQERVYSQNLKRIKGALKEYKASHSNESVDDKINQLI